MKRLRADDSADSRVKVGHRQALHQNAPTLTGWGVLLWAAKPRNLSTSAHNKEPPLAGGQA